MYEIGEFTYGTPIIAKWVNSAKLKIGKFCSIAPQVNIMLGGNHRPDWVTTYPFSDFRQFRKWGNGHPATKGDVIIENDVWIGMGATILSGVKISNGAVIGANAVVSKSVEPYAIVVGNPSRVVKKRFTDEQIRKLLEIKWWDWTYEKISQNMHLMLTTNIDDFISAHYQKDTP